MTDDPHVTVLVSPDVSVVIDPHATYQIRDGRLVELNQPGWEQSVQAGLDLLSRHRITEVEAAVLFRSLVDLACLYPNR